MRSGQKNKKSYVSGWVCQPAAGASTRWENSDYRKRLDSCTAARVFFISPGESRVELTLNDSLRREFTVEGAPNIRQIAVTAPHVRSLSFKVLSVDLRVLKAIQVDLGRR